VPEQAQAKPQPVVADLETILQERDACGVSIKIFGMQRSSVRYCWHRNSQQ
jgi:hypothetical protein